MRSVFVTAAVRTPSPDCRINGFFRSLPSLVLPLSSPAFQRSRLQNLNDQLCSSLSGPARMVAIQLHVTD